MKTYTVVLGGLLTFLLVGCATESSRTVETSKPAAALRVYTGVKAPLVVGKFENRSTYLRGVFSDGIDRLGNQAKTVLIAHLQQSGRFSVMDRDNLQETKEEARLAGQSQKLKAGSFVVTGDVTEFGRKEVGDMQLFGIMGQGRKQIAHAKVTLNIVDVGTSEVLYSVQGAGEYALDNREVLGFGSTATYDSTLNGKVLDLAMRQAVDALVVGMESGAWNVKP